MQKEYIKDGVLNHAMIRETGAPSKYGLDSIEKVLGDQQQNVKAKL